MHLMQIRKKPVVLVILDGWGEREAKEHNAIAAAHTPHYTRLKCEYPCALLHASELDVGLPCGQMGNSEVGHMNIGAGRVVMQELPRIDQAVQSGELARHPMLLDFIQALKQSGGACHLMGLLSDGGVHAHQSHMAALHDILREAGVEVRVHAFLDGRDTAPKSALEALSTFARRIDTVSGRYYAMDRDKRWERVEKAYACITQGQGVHFHGAVEAVEAAYAAGVTDEFVEPCVTSHYTGMQEGDGVLMANFRADRARQLLTALLAPDFDKFPRAQPQLAAALGMVEYSETLAPFIPALFPPRHIHHTLGECVATAGLVQLRVAETEKYAHVTFFFNAGREEPFAGEERILIPSPRVATYDLQPEMAAAEVTARLLEAVESGKYDFIAANYANADMVGHTGDFNAAVKAVEALDVALGKISEAVLAKDGALLVTADHGNVEQMFDHETGQAHTAHSLNPVPALLVGHGLAGKATSRTGRLEDIAPTLLAWLGLRKPAEMTGRSLLDDVA